MARKQDSDTGSELNAMLKKEAVTLFNAEKYAKTAKPREDARADSYESAILDRFQKGKCSLEELLIEIYLSEMSIRAVEDVSKRIWGSRISLTTISDLINEISENITKWNSRDLSGGYCPYVFIDAVNLRRNSIQDLAEITVLLAVGIDESGYRTALGAAIGNGNEDETWTHFLSSLHDRGLDGVCLIISGKYPELQSAARRVYPSAHLQLSTAAFYGNVLKTVPKAKRQRIAKALKAIHYQESSEAAIAKANSVSEELRRIQATNAAALVDEGYRATLSYMEYPAAHWGKIKTDAIISGLTKQLRRRTRIIGAALDESSALMLVSARLRYIAAQRWKRVTYTSMSNGID